MNFQIVCNQVSNSIINISVAHILNQQLHICTPQQDRKQVNNPSKTQCKKLGMITKHTPCIQKTMIVLLVINVFFFFSLAKFCHIFVLSSQQIGSKQYRRMRKSSLLSYFVYSQIRLNCLMGDPYFNNIIKQTPKKKKHQLQSTNCIYSSSEKIGNTTTTITLL